MITFLLDILIGSSGMKPAEVLKIFFRSHTVSKAQKAIIWDIRLPTALMALIVGASLGVSGATMQTILNNPLASPYTLGLSAGAGFGASFAIVIGLGKLPIGNGFAVPLCAFLCSLIACAGIYYISKKKDFPQELWYWPVSEWYFLSGRTILYAIYCLYRSTFRHCFLDIRKFK